MPHGEPSLPDLQVGHRRAASAEENVHIEDMRAGVHDHLMFGEGEMDFAEVLGALREVGYAGGAHVELSRHSHDAVARRALAFLRAVSRETDWHRSALPL